MSANKRSEEEMQAFANSYKRYLKARLQASSSKAKEKQTGDREFVKNRRRGNDQISVTPKK